MIEEISKKSFEYFITPENINDMALRIKEQIKNLLAISGISYEGYFDRVKKINKYNSVLFSDKYFSVLDTFVPPLVTCGEYMVEHFYNSNATCEKIGPDNSIRAFDLESLIKKDNFLVTISGPAGSGKSLLLKYLLLNMLDNGQMDKIPLFIMLSNYNLIENDNIEKLVLHSLEEYNCKIGQKQLEECLNTGMFVLFMDGYDEIDNHDIGKGEKNNSHFIKKLKSFVNKYQSDDKDNTNIIVISSRTVDDIISNFDGVTNYSICPFVREMAKKQVQQFPSFLNDGVYRNNFIRSLKYDRKERKDRYSLNPLIVSNPLFLTFVYKLGKDSEEQIPRTFKLYQNIFNSLFTGVHRYKGSGNLETMKQHKAHLNSDDFEKLLALYSYNVCVNAKYEKVKREEVVSRFNIIKQNRDFRDYLGNLVDVDLNDFVDDLIDCGLFRKKGKDYYEIIHETFYEYFAMMFICGNVSENTEKYSANLITKRTEYSCTGMVFSMFYEKGRGGKFDKDVIYPQLLKFEDRAKKKYKINEIEIVHYFKEMIPDFIINKNNYKIEFGRVKGKFEEHYFLVACGGYYVETERESMSEIERKNLDDKEVQVARKLCEIHENRFEERKEINPIIYIDEVLGDDSVYELFRQCWVGRRIQILFELKRRINESINNPDAASVEF